MKSNFRIVALMSAAVAATGCATVDMTEMAIPTAAKAQAPAGQNIVIRAASQLHTTFASKGFIDQTSPKKTQSAASILLNGLEERELVSDVDYSAQNLPRALLIENIAYASTYVRRTVDAANVYFDMSEGKDKLREELVALEQALLTCREASAAFEEALGPDSVELRNLNAKVGRLKLVTDKFGKRVREQAAADMAARRNENS